MLNVDLFLQRGGIGYLLAKILLAFAEGMNDGRKWRIIGWFSYLIGIPAWVILLGNKIIGLLPLLIWVVFHL
jgi:hypothetical protein